MSGRYTHIVKRDSGYVAGWFRGEPPAEFVAECNRNVPGDPAHAEAIPEWPEDFEIPCPARHSDHRAPCIAVADHGGDHRDEHGCTWKTA